MGDFFSKLLGGETPDDPNTGGAGDSGGNQGEVQEWCRLTRDEEFRIDGTVCTPALCGSVMEKDKSHILSNVDSFIFDLGPEDTAHLREGEDSIYSAINLTSYDNSSKIMKQGTTHAPEYVDDPRWMIELGNRVRK